MGSYIPEVYDLGEILDNKVISPMDKIRLICDSMGLEIFEHPIDYEVALDDGSLLKDGWYARPVCTHSFEWMIGPLSYDDLMATLMCLNGKITNCFVY